MKTLRSCIQTGSDGTAEVRLLTYDVTRREIASHRVNLAAELKAIVSTGCSRIEVSPPLKVIVNENAASFPATRRRTSSVCRTIASRAEKNA